MINTYKTDVVLVHPPPPSLIVCLYSHFLGAKACIKLGLCTGRWWKVKISYHVKRIQITPEQVQRGRI